MPYTINIPTATQLISASQPLIAQNFTELQTWASIDHSPLASAPGTLEGFHYKTTFVPQGPPLTAPLVPATLFPVGYPGLFGAIPSNINPNPPIPQTGINELWIHKIRDAAGNGALFPLTASIYAKADVVGEGFFYLPGGQIVKYGKIAVPAVGNIAYGIYNYEIVNTKPAFGATTDPIVFLTMFSGGLATLTPIVITSDNIGFNYSVLNNNNALSGNTNMFFLSIGAIT